MAPTVGAYNRYVPPPNMDTVAAMNTHLRFDDEAPPAKKVKLDAKMDDLSLLDSNPKEAPGSDNEVKDEKKDKKKKKSKKKKSKKSTAPEDPTAEDVDIGIDPTTAVADTGLELEEPPASEEKKKRDKKKEKKKKSEAETEANDADIDEDPIKSRHKSVFEKKAKSMKAPDPANVVVSQDQDDVPMVDAPQPQEVRGLQPLPQPEPKAPEPLNTLQKELPRWIWEHVQVSRETTAPFTSFGRKPESGITPEIAKELAERGYKEPTAVQTAVIPRLLPYYDNSKHCDLLVSAETGSGKTLAYVLPMIRDLSQPGQFSGFLRALVVVPSKNLAQQVKKVCDECAQVFPATGENRRRAKIGTATGRRSFNEEKDALIERSIRWDPEGYRARLERVKLQSRRDRPDEDSEDEERNEMLRREDRIKTLPNFVTDYKFKCDVLICTPGRLMEHIRLTPGFTLNNVRWLVLDEVDKFFRKNYQQFFDDVIPRLHVSSGLWQRKHMDSSLNGVRKVILSASMTTDLDRLEPLKLMRPKLVEIVSEAGSEESGRDIMLALPATLYESALKVDLELKPLFLLDLLESHHIMRDDTDDSSDTDSAAEAESAKRPASLLPPVLVFTRTRENALRLARLLGIMAPKMEHLIGCITSDSVDKKQTQTLNAFRAGKLRIIIASDLIARGIDLPDVQHVINYDMPNSITSYVHRVGRTARAQRSGHAWTMYTHQEAHWFWNDVAGSSAGIRRTREVERVRVTEKKEAAFDEKKTRFEAALRKLAE